MTEKDRIDGKKEYLNAYKGIHKKLISLEEQLESLRITKESARTQILSDMPKSKTHTDLSDYIVKIDDMISRIDKLKKECMDKKLDIETHIFEMPDGVEAEIIYKRYLEFKTWEQICTEIGYSWRQTHRLHNKALNNFQI
ncbi:hypothetical protein EDD66_105312 [Mobilisporobacter senegalensis]|uniref:DUF1492 domain-containing protein n=1 Tax=Mobilisporobacter senegalensis TaxID=1329262 RepID=A0A3N1XNV3_9FIRM|nr:hypothetical protein [Mobilisporobacter senegalensis]ROR28370.1 hypothetical protein EDD66_105312 [Mobilisporobacter senegalensis]